MFGYESRSKRYNNAQHNHVILQQFALRSSQVKKEKITVAHSNTFIMRLTCIYSIQTFWKFNHMSTWCIILAEVDQGPEEVKRDPSPSQWEVRRHYPHRWGKIIILQVWLLVVKTMGRYKTTTKPLLVLKPLQNLSSGKFSPLSLWLKRWLQCVAMSVGKICQIVCF